MLGLCLDLENPISWQPKNEISNQNSPLLGEKMETTIEGLI